MNSSSKLEEKQMNKEGYSVNCSKCGSTDVKYDYDKTTFNEQTKQTNTPARCNGCGYETEETK